MKIIIPEKPRENLDQILLNTDPKIASILDKSLNNYDLNINEIKELFETQNINALIATADELRFRQTGNIVTYVVTRNINFTNVCIKRCGFCAFSREYKESEGYFISISEIVNRAKEAQKLGATEICIQAGLAPKMKGNLYNKICLAVKKALPKLHIHAFSPEEVLYGSLRSKQNIHDYLSGLKESGVDSLPGTSAEILVQKIRDKISPGRISVEKWKQVITTAHKLKIPTTSTIMFGHIESSLDRAIHLNLIKNIQIRTNGFTEFVPLNFIRSEAPMFTKKIIKMIPRSNKTDSIKMHSISRIVLGNYIPNLQVSWVKEGFEFAQTLLKCGVNDLGGTLINESISTSAGSKYGQLASPKILKKLARNSGKIPAERYTTYKLKKIFKDPEKDTLHPLDNLTSSTQKQLGSYFEMIKSSKFKYEFNPNKNVS